MVLPASALHAVFKMDASLIAAVTGTSAAFSPVTSWPAHEVKISDPLYDLTQHPDPPALASPVPARKAASSAYEPSHGTVGLNMVIPLC